MTTFKHYKIVAMVLSLWLAATGFAGAQSARDSIEMIRADLKADRNALMAEAMNLTEAESQAFWPLYRSYRAEVEKATDRLVKLILEYADAYPNVPESKASEMLKQYTKVEAEVLSIKRKYLKKLEKVLPASKVFRFAQLDNRFDLGTRLSLAASIPVLPAGPTQPVAEQP